jgi:hypothetical protein
MDFARLGCFVESMQLVSSGAQPGWLGLRGTGIALSHLPGVYVNRQLRGIL